MRMHILIVNSQDQKMRKNLSGHTHPHSLDRKKDLSGHTHSHSLYRKIQKNLSGPVILYKFAWNGIPVEIYGDRHNSKSGRCASDCDTYSESGGMCEARRSVASTCIEFPLYLSDLMLEANQKGEHMSFYFEHPYVKSDPVNTLICPNLEDLDYIDTMSVVMIKSLLKDKSHSPYLPNVHVHYTDIRDYFASDFSPEGRRTSTSANPFSGSWIVLSLDRACDSQQIDDAIRSMTIILHYVPLIVKLFLSTDYDHEMRVLLSRLDEEHPPDIMQAWLERLHHTEDLTSTYRGKKMHRVAKQLHKLNDSDRNIVTEWCMRNIQSELRISSQLYVEWKEKLSNPNVDYSSIREMPIMIVIAISSVLMDTYTLSRMIYQSRTNRPTKIIFFAGSAHCDNYRNFFLSVGARSTGVITPPDNYQRCLLKNSLT